MCGDDPSADVVHLSSKVIIQDKCMHYKKRSKEYVININGTPMYCVKNGMYTRTLYQDSC